MRSSFFNSRVLFGFVTLCCCLLAVSVSPVEGQEVVREDPPKLAGSEKAISSPDIIEKTVGGIKVTFAPDKAGIAFVEVNGKRIRIDTNEMTADAMDKAATGDGVQATEPLQQDIPVASNQIKKDTGSKDDDRFDFEKGYEPFDYRIVNVPTPKNVPKGSWNVVFTHRFTQQLDPISESAPNLLGLDSFGVASFGISYGITDKLYASAYRSPVCQRGLCKVIEIGLGYNWLAQDKEHPIGLTTYASIEGNDNFTEEYTYNIQAMFSGRIGKRVHLFFAPALHINSNGERRFDPRPNDYFPPAVVASSYRLPVHGATFGFGVSVSITPNVVALFDIAARAGFKLGRVRPIFDSNFRVAGFDHESFPSMGFGIQRNVGEHSFALTFSNTQTTTTSRYNSSNLVLAPKDFIIGFNLSRRF